MSGVDRCQMLIHVATGNLAGMSASSLSQTSIPNQLHRHPPPERSDLQIRNKLYQSVSSSSEKQKLPSVTEELSHMQILKDEKAVNESGNSCSCFLSPSVSLLSDALAIHTAMAVAIANGGTQRPQRPQRCSTGAGPKFKLIHEGDIQVCRLNHSRTLISKVLSSKFLRRWEAHHVYLGDFQMYSATVS
ncbi:hypothetical protein OS493_030325 [Desmophyllum pertusum]|uniref:C-Maf-inducing protein PH domain-containing protein n=1 Tax=Desmophyllum pertusum TaxID=174260 RepID=A0A9X0D1G1_9CNID|nr:hypothetical protein OS493_030325 [Desmophyllum pertusum]